MIFIKKVTRFFFKSLKVYLRTKSLREVLNSHFSAADRVVLNLKDLNHLVMRNGVKYYPSKLLMAVSQATQDYSVDDISPDDLVIDVGASVGGFSIPVSYKAKHVHAIEPMTPEMLRDNIKLNGVSNITVHECALGDGNELTINWAGSTKVVKTKPLREIIAMCGGCTFLKIDCEGKEWEIDSADLAGIRRIEMEVHQIGFPIEIMGKRLRAAGFNYTVVEQPDADIGLWIIHAKRESVI